MGLLLTMGGSWPWGGATHHGKFLIMRQYYYGRFLTMMARLSWVSFSLLIASTAGRFLGHGGVTHHGRFLTMIGVATHHGRFLTMRGATQNGRFLTMRGATKNGRFLTMMGCYSPWEVSGTWMCCSPWEVPDHEGCYSPWEVPDHVGVLLTMEGSWPWWPDWAGFPSVYWSPPLCTWTSLPPDCHLQHTTL